ncbi:monooxygenase, FAD-binding [Labilithrix luteola]|uniref:Monooxygenase, FAD-binding n=1 Tax=Labilithrix luteola TaxID=1391654 RepID=A0A0K1Q2J8_9BACT|nr:monooxygenase, FAD-binding [Labilithrix luteola]
MDVRGPAVEVAERMHVMPRLREVATSVTDLVFLNPRGERVGRVDVGVLRQASGSREVELPRGDLAAALYEASRDSAEFVFGDSIATLNQDAHGVNVTFEHGVSRRFDLVIGADGLHSTVRRLAFGPESDFVEPTGIWVATMPMPGAPTRAHEILMHNMPGRLTSIHPSRGKALVAFIFRDASTVSFDPRDTEQHKRKLLEAYDGDVWRLPELLSYVRETSELYFDSVSRVRMTSWSRGRVALLGDAASCVSLFGEGSSLAMSGAFSLANALADTPDDPIMAFRRYEAEHRRLVMPKQEGVALAAALLVPKTKEGITLRNWATHLWPAAAAAAWAKRRVSSATVS